MSDTSGTFDSWADRLTYLLAEAQLIVMGIAVSLGALLIWIRPSVPGVPPVARGMFAASLLLGPPLLALFVTGARKLRQRRMIEVHHINGVEDVREKYYVEPGVWDDKTVEGPSPYRVNDGEAFEVREFDWHPDQGETGTLIVTGCYFSQIADSKLVTVKAMLEDIHGELIETAIAYNKLRGRISRMGVEIERDTINAHAEADERGLMTQKTSVKDRFEAAEEDVDEWSSDEISDLGEYEHDFDATAPGGSEPVTIEQGGMGMGEPAANGGSE
ncbi:hypothetical protein [Natronolimnohabitans innermongolicus]|uniref:Uncharacterized protein n=1 Tax=Natronolimnohabitans innermongolicus JCM 12255 TaxID=1227499 RepID=L9WTJ1_9EURY|nr:hypothetical protein [Natronolimnohabitans innermongolicus]ELY52794.1 hypothetical protein C493_15523 [Natronolimnohabitans innermongolicus JCM 12255]